MPSESPAPDHQLELEGLLASMPQGLAAVIGLVPGWLWTTGPDHRFTWFSDGFEAYTGDAPSAYLGRSRRDHLERIGVRDGTVARHLDDIEAHRPFMNFVYPTVYSRGETWLRVGGLPVHGADGAFEGYKGIAMPIDAVMARAEAALPQGTDLAGRVRRLRRSLRERTDALGDVHVLLQEVVEGIDQGLIVSSADWDRGGRVLMSNRRFHALTGMPEEVAAAGAPVADAVEWLGADAVYGTDPDTVRSVQSRIRAGEPTLLPGPSRTGRRLLLRRRARPDGGAVTTLTDVTAMEAARRTAVDAAEARAAFLASISHEFRTPMNAVLGMAEVLAEGLPDGEMGECAATLREAAGALGRMLDDVIDYADAMGSGAMGPGAMGPGAMGPGGEGEGADQGPPVAPAAGAGPPRGREADGPPPEAPTPQGGWVRRDDACDLAELALEALEEVAGELRAKGLSGRVDLAPGVPTVRRVEAGPLRRALRALVANAVKFTDGGGVTIRIADDAGPADGQGAGRAVRIEVVDTGPGVPPDQRERIWEGFAQGETGLARRHGGVGLGLSLARRLAEGLGGRIELTTPPDGGACFAIALHADAPGRPVTL